MANLSLLVICFVLGLAARRWLSLPVDAHRGLNAWMMYVSLPALIVRSIHRAPLEASTLVASSCLWLIFAIPASVAWLKIQRGGQKGALGALALCSGLGNTAFVGLPLLDALGGSAAAGLAAVVDQLGSFLAFSFLAVPFASWLSGHELEPQKWMMRLVLSPSIVALLLALALRGVAFPAALDGVLERLAGMLSPLALASIGFQFDATTLRGNGRSIAVGLSWKLVAAPALVLGLLWAWKGPLTLSERVVVAQAAMAPMVTAGVLASDSGLDGRLAAALIAVGVPLSFLTVPLWWYGLSSMVAP